MSKFKLTKNKKDYFGTTLYQIEATMSFGDIAKGELGGWIEKKENLSEDGDAWVSGNARVSGDAQVYGDAWVYGHAWDYGKLKLLAGWFFGIRYKKEDIKYVKIDDDNELIYKGEAKFGEDEVKSLSGKTVKVEIDGVGYEAIIK